ncbi:coenzyme F420 biosynthesis-associated protein [Mangrovactinospora gilvigrisea]|uniref:Coenzyme F420 biosynthesis-associated protein n=1 Tax=Mangrovactinospora gilvigrisea TaxID=1428644 RepID=A0A1J7CB36_9ACTN|nr:zinc-dependent metalloprotease [Mangrovactinospora gilvigrisea]OIV36850.1 coenzyme F420 biosynthesis-associated protein [Mangrovactinospora gilvigrisea]
MTSSGADMVDWNLAVATATRLVRPGPDISPDEARAVVAELRQHAAESEQHVRSFTKMSSPDGGTPVLVVDRPGWIKANVAGFSQLLQPLAEKMAAKRSAAVGGSFVGTVGGKITGLELGMLLAFLSSRVLGQYETFAPTAPQIAPAAAGQGTEASGDATTGDAPPKAGRLLLVAPNVVHVERELDVDPHDFRLWVCLHEETHRTQFTAVPWLRDHIEGEIQTFLAETEMDPATLFERAREAVQAMSGSSEESGEGGGHSSSPSLVELVQTPAQREILDRLTAVMSLLEGHADYVMDGVGPQVVPSVKEIREKFAQRRKQGTGRLDQALRRLLGLDAKLRQYQEGERFVRGVVDAVGMDGFNRVWTSPNTLPSRDEINDPSAWVSRVAHK